MTCECRFDVVIKTIKFNNLTDQVAQGSHSCKVGHASREAHEVTMSVMRSRRRRGVCLDVVEYGVRSAVETTSAMVKLAFELSLVCETRVFAVSESYEQGADTSRTHSLVTGVCERNVSAKYQREG